MNQYSRLSSSQTRNPSDRLIAIFSLWLLYLFLGYTTRLGLLLLNGDASLMAPDKLIAMFALGLIYDSVVGALWMLPPILLYGLCSNGTLGKTIFRVLITLIVIVYVPLWLFIHSAEFAFWKEFSSRFNFIAVDYLLWTREVIGNIRESYNLRALSFGLAVTSMLIFFVMRRYISRGLGGHAPGIWKRLQITAGLTGSTLLAFTLVQSSWKDTLDQHQLIQLAANGEWEFCYAYSTNQIDYETYYKTIDAAEAKRILREEFSGLPHYRITASAEDTNPIVRQVFADGPEQKRNVILVSIESFGAEFIKSLGGTEGLTPEFEKLVQQGLYFTRLYATGIRTVRGLEALTLSIPPTPGHSVVMRPNSGNLFTLGSVFREKGYQSCYIYGGYSYFDNMKQFFSSNGYEVIDRTQIADSDIHHETVWGVADEDLFTKALAVMDEKTARAEPVFAHIMTTSNHRPFTYPENRIDIPSGTGREGAVKYSDYAIGEFIRKAKTHDWFDDTLFVFVADHTSNRRNRSDLPMERFHIPMVFYAPGFIEPGIVSTPASQIDVGPTILSVLNFNYKSNFYGRDIFRDGKVDPHIFLANYQTVGFVEGNMLAVLKPNQVAYVLDTTTNQSAEGNPDANHSLMEAIAYYQTVAHEFSIKGEQADSAKDQVAQIPHP